MCVLRRQVRDGPIPPDRKDHTLSEHEQEIEETEEPDVEAHRFERNDDRTDRADGQSRFDDRVDRVDRAE